MVKNSFFRRVKTAKSELMKIVLIWINDRLSLYIYIKKNNYVSMRDLHREKLLKIKWERVAYTN